MMNNRYDDVPRRAWIGGALLLCLAVGAPAHAQRLMEALDRGVVAVAREDGAAFVGWRLLGTDSGEVGFNVYRVAGDDEPVKLNEAPIGDVTFFVDVERNPAQACGYRVAAVIEGVEREPGTAFTLPAGNDRVGYLELPLQTPDGYRPNDASVGDLDGDGQYEIVLHQAGRARDNSQRGRTDPPILEAYELDGTLLWRINLGINIREGAHYTQFLVYDFDGDGRAEVVCKTGDGTTDAEGGVIGDADADHRTGDGLVLSGPEYLTVFDGRTGAALATTDYIPPRHPDKPDPTRDELRRVWGDDYGNRSDRFLACVAYLDGGLPSIVMCRGYYTRTVLAAWDWRGGALTQRWVFDSNEGGRENRRYAGQGNHNLSVADVDADGRDEIVYGSMVIDDDGTGLYSTGWGHGDAIHVADMDPSRPGLEVFMPHESPRSYGPNAVSLRDAATGELIWGVAGSRDIGRGVAFDIDPRFPGYEAWASGGIGGLYNVASMRDGGDDGPRAVPVAETWPGQMNFGVWWDGDPLREILDRNQISKWDWERERVRTLLTAEGCSSNNGTKATPTLSGDLLGDWREEVIWRTDDGDALRVYTTTIPTDRRLVTLMHDPQYRLSIAWQNVAYNQPPHPGFFLGHDMADPPRPDIRVPQR